MPLDSLSGSIAAAISLAIAKTNTGLNDTTNQISINKIINYTTGTGANGANLVYSAVRTLAASTAETLDLSGSLSDLVGNTSLAFTKVRALYIGLLSTADDTTNGTAASSITVGNAASNQFLGPLGGATHTITIPNGGFAFFGRSDATGWAVANGSTDNLKILNNDAGVIAAYWLVVLGSG